MPIAIPQGFKHIDSGFYEVSEALAKRIAAANGRSSLPKWGYQLEAKWEDREWILQRTPHHGKTVWSMHRRRYTEAEMSEMMYNYRQAVANGTARSWPS